jgi:hypothetical protein
MGSQKTHVSLVPQAQTGPTHSTPIEGSRSSSKFGLQAPTLETRSQPRCSNLHLSPPPINWSRKSQNPRPESNEPFCSHKQVCAQDNKSVTWLPFTAMGGPQSTRIGKTVQPSSAPWPRDITCYTHKYPYQIPTWSPFSFIILLWE